MFGFPDYRPVSYLSLYLAETKVYAIPENNLRQEMLWGFVANPAMGTVAQTILPPYEGPLTPVVEVSAYAMGGKEITLTLKITAALHDVELTTFGKFRPVPYLHWFSRAFEPLLLDNTSFSVRSHTTYWIKKIRKFD